MPVVHAAQHQKPAKRTLPALRLTAAKTHTHESAIEKHTHKSCKLVSVLFSSSKRESNHARHARHAIPKYMSSRMHHSDKQTQIWLRDEACASRCLQDAGNTQTACRGMQHTLLCCCSALIVYLVLLTKPAVLAACSGVAAAAAAALLTAWDPEVRLPHIVQLCLAVPYHTHTHSHVLPFLCTAQAGTLCSAAVQKLVQQTILASELDTADTRHLQIAFMHSWQTHDRTATPSKDASFTFPTSLIFSSCDAGMRGVLQCATRITCTAVSHASAPCSRTLTFNECKRCGIAVSLSLPTQLPRLSALVCGLGRMQARCCAAWCEGDTMQRCAAGSST
jgi:hypothetical protein